MFHEDSPFYKPLEQEIFCPVSTNDSIVSVSQSTGEDRDFDPGVDDVESLSSDDFDYANCNRFPWGSGLAKGYRY